VFVKPLVSLGSWSSMATPTHTFLRRSMSQELAQELRSIVRRLRNVAAKLECAVRITAPALSKGRFA
jgi:cytochrome P450